MKATDFAMAVAIAQVDFQGEVIMRKGTVSDGLSAFLRTEPFPQSPPPSLRNAHDYSGLKLFVYQGNFVCVAHFYDAGRNDEFQRAVPSATVLIFDRELYQGGFRNLPALQDFLIDVSQNAVEENDLLSVLHSIYVEATITDSVKQFRSFLSGLGADYDLLASASGLLAAHHQLLLCTPSLTRGKAFLAALFAISTVEFFELANWCTYASSLSSRHEDVIVCACQLDKEETGSWLNRIKNRFGGEKPITPGLDIGNHIVQGPIKKAPNRRVAEQIIHEISANQLALQLPFPERFLLLTTLLGKCCQDAQVTITGLPSKAISSEDVVRLEGFLKEAASKE